MSSIPELKTNEDFFADGFRQAGIAGGEAAVAALIAGGFLAPKVWFTAQQAANYICISEQTLARYVSEKTAPESVKVGNGRRFHRDALDTWIRNGGVNAFVKSVQS
ncbi:MAG: helix-turn-helix domain-containing protein [Pseudolabrys sp.]|nr:helix-turn-helix domain-containing protein [Pseudolabrys sp.]MDP2295458.1 helix-turn-helix domain-containing protein [Pseudolabrys sp.]